MSDDLRTLGRAKNGLLEFFEKSLYIPKIYLDATWDGYPVDVLAIDRDGSGDVHAVLLFSNDCSSGTAGEDLSRAFDLAMAQLQQIPAQYKYMGSVDVSPGGEAFLPSVHHPVFDRSFSPDGIGRVGFLIISSNASDEPMITLVFKPERFRAKIAKLATDYVQQHEADWEIRA